MSESGFDRSDAKVTKFQDFRIFHINYSPKLFHARSRFMTHLSQIPCQRLTDS